jgi:hypothetical protein
MRSMPHEVARQATQRAAAAACGIASPLLATAAAPLWRALSDRGPALLVYDFDHLIDALDRRALDERR